MDRLIRCLPIVLGAFLFVCPDIASAQAGTESDDSSDQVARGLFQAGRASYDAGKYEDALKYFQQAYDLSQRPGLLYNIGQAADRLHQDQKTIEVFRLYLERVPDADNRAEVEGRLRTLERLVAAEAAAQENATPTTPSGTDTTAQHSTQVSLTPTSTSTQSDGPGIAPWLLIGGGGAVAVAGLVLTLVGNGQIADVEDAERGSMWSSVEGKADSGPTLATTGVVMLTLGVASAAVGVVWMLSASGEDHVEMVIGPGAIAIAGTL